jgi:TusA-related sulfurtransferase
MRTVDLRGVACPFNFLKAKLAVDGIKSSEHVEFLLDELDPVRRVSKGMVEDGHRVLTLREKEGTYSLVVEKRVESQSMSA